MAITIGQSASVTSGLIFHLDAGNTASYPGTGATWTDLSGNANHGTLVNSPTYVNGALVFNGVNNYVNMGSSISLQRDFTLEIYVYITRDASGLFGLGVYGTGTGLHILWNTLGSRGIIFGMYGNDLDSPSYNLNVGAWNHLTFTYSHSTYLKQFYSNGVLFNSATNTIFSGTGQLNIGANYSTPSTFLSGRISNAKMYSRVLTAGEVLQNYNSLSKSGITYSDGSSQPTKFDSTTNTGKLLSISSFPTAGTSTWTKPGGCTNVIVKVVGGGGGAAAYCESGGAGGFTEKRIDVTAVSTVSVTVGAGAAQAAYAGGTNGGTSSFGTYCSATGGYGSNQNFSHSGGHGGIGSSGDINLYGGSGTGHTNGSGAGALGNGGQSYWGGGNNLIGRHQDPGGFRNAAPGSGGCGGVTDYGYLGSAGQTGLVVIWEYT